MNGRRAHTRRALARAIAVPATWLSGPCGVPAGGPAADRPPVRPPDPPIAILPALEAGRATRPVPGRVGGPARSVRRTADASAGTDAGAPTDG